MKHAALIALTLALALPGRVLAQGTGGWHGNSDLCPLEYQVIKRIALTCNKRKCEQQCRAKRDDYLRRGFEREDRR